jgi:hypothetical protein
MGLVSDLVQWSWVKPEPAQVRRESGKTLVGP